MGLTDDLVLEYANLQAERHNDPAQEMQPSRGPQGATSIKSTLSVNAVGQTRH